MRFIFVATSLLGLAAAGPCKPRSKTSIISATATSTSVSSQVTESSSSATSVFSSSVSVSTTSTSISSVSSDVTSTSSGVSSSSVTSSASESSIVSSTSVTSVSSTSVSSVSSTSVSSASSTSVASSDSSSSTSASSSSIVSSTSESSSPIVTSTSASSSASTPATTSSAPSTTSFTSTSSTPSSTINPATARVTNAVALTFYDPNLNDGTDVRDPPTSGYICYAGPAINFPPMSSWASFEAMWTLLSQNALLAIGDTPTQAQQIRAAILDVSQKARVDPRVILAVIVDESTGNVNVPCTANGVPNCGLMQAYNSSSYNPNDSANSIHLMVQDGTQGTQYGPGLVQLLNGSPLSTGSTNGNLWTALRAYNSGSFDAANLSDGRGATAAYVSNIANFLQGWVGYGTGPDGCDFSTPVNSQPNTP